MPCEESFHFLVAYEFPTLCLRNALSDRGTCLFIKPFRRQALGCQGKQKIGRQSLIFLRKLTHFRDGLFK